MHGMYAAYTSFQLSLLIVLSWTTGNIIEGFVVAFIFSKMIKQRT